MKTLALVSMFSLVLCGCVGDRQFSRSVPRPVEGSGAGDNESSPDDSERCALDEERVGEQCLPIVEPGRAGGSEADPGAEEVGSEDEEVPDPDSDGAAPGGEEPAGPVEGEDDGSADVEGPDPPDAEGGEAPDGAFEDENPPEEEEEDPLGCAGTLACFETCDGVMGRARSRCLGRCAEHASAAGLAGALNLMGCKQIECPGDERCLARECADLEAACNEEEPSVPSCAGLLMCGQLICEEGTADDCMDEICDPHAASVAYRDAYRNVFACINEECPAQPISVCLGAQDPCWPAYVQCLRRDDPAGDDAPNARRECGALCAELGNRGCGDVDVGDCLGFCEAATDGTIRCARVAAGLGGVCMAEVLRACVPAEEPIERDDCGSLQFDPADPAVPVSARIPDGGAANFGASAAWTFETWLLPNPLAQPNQEAFLMGHVAADGGVRRGWALLAGPLGPSFVTWSAGMPTRLDAEVGAGWVEEWAHLAVTLHDGKMEIFLHGESVAMVRGGPVPQPFDAPLYLGYHPALPEFAGFRGQLDEVRISHGLGYDGPYLVDDTLGVDEQTVGYWTFDEAVAPNGLGVRDGVRRTMDGRLVTPEAGQLHWTPEGPQVGCL